MTERLHTIEYDEKFKRWNIHIECKICNRFHFWKGSGRSAHAYELHIQALERYLRHFKEYHKDMLNDKEKQAE